MIGPISIRPEFTILSKIDSILIATVMNPAPTNGIISMSSVTN
jgi:hypothetical protein